MTFSDWKNDAVGCRASCAGYRTRDDGRADAGRAIELLCRELLSRRGEAVGRAIAQEILTVYERMDEPQRLSFFQLMRDAFAPDRDAVGAAAARFLDDPSDTALATLARSVEAPRQELFRRLNMAKGGTGSIIRMRADLLSALQADKSLRAFDTDLLHLLGSWFNPGFLELRRIGWWCEAAVLEKLIAYEAVHEIRDWDDLRRRLDSDRRCFAFFHPALPNEPLIFIEVALTRGVARRIDAVIDAPAGSARAADADTAVFYSINNCQDGLRGISFGNFLIKLVVAELQAELPDIATFVTLSPVPGFVRWLNGDGRALAETATGQPLGALIDSDGIVRNQPPDEFKRPILALCAHYLTEVKRGTRPLDPVLGFHVGNGATLESINWHADPSPNGLQQSLGVMVNYAYEMDSIVENHEAFATSGTIPVDPEITELKRWIAMLRTAA